MRAFFLKFIFLMLFGLSGFQLFCMESKETSSDEEIAKSLQITSDEEMAQRLQREEEAKLTTARPVRKQVSREIHRRMPERVISRAGTGVGSASARRERLSDPERFKARRQLRTGATSTAASASTTAPAERTAEVDVDYVKAITDSVRGFSELIDWYERAKLVYPDSNEDLLNLCDSEMPDYFDNTGRVIKQFSALYQFYPVLMPRYGMRYNLFCGYYAAFFAKFFLEHKNAPDYTLASGLKDRKAFDSFLGSLSAGKSLKDLEVNISGSDILNILGSVGIDVSRIVIIGSEEGEMLDKLERLVREFAGSSPDPVVLILPSHEMANEHWFTALVRINATGHVEFIIADSSGIDRRDSDAILRLYTRFNKGE